MNPRLNVLVTCFFGALGLLSAGVWFIWFGYVESNIFLRVAYLSIGGGAFGVGLKFVWWVWWALRS